MISMIMNAVMYIDHDIFVTANYKMMIAVACSNPTAHIVEQELTVGEYAEKMVSQLRLVLDESDTGHQHQQHDVKVDIKCDLDMLACDASEGVKAHVSIGDSFMETCDLMELFARGVCPVAQEFLAQANALLKRPRSL
jgi:hypothetical protein